MFFGRQQETHRLVELLTPTLQRGPGRLVAVVGPSGSGKSSLLHAGLLPRLARMPERWVVVPPLRPGRQPTAQPGRLPGPGLRRPRPTPSGRRAGRRAGTRVRRGWSSWPANWPTLAGNGGGRPGVLVVIDQAEELLTRTGAREQQAFLRLLTGALHEDSPVWAVATVRSEFLSTAPDRAGLAEAVDDPLVIEPLSRARLAEVIARPAQRAGLDFEPGPGRADGGGHRRRGRAAAAGLHPARALPAGRTRRHDQPRPTTRPSAGSSARCKITPIGCWTSSPGAVSDRT